MPRHNQKASISFSHSTNIWSLWPGTGHSTDDKMWFLPSSLHVGGGDYPLGWYFIDFLCKDQLFCSNLFNFVKYIIRHLDVSAVSNCYKSFWNFKEKGLEIKLHLELPHYLPSSVAHGPAAWAPPKWSLEMQNLRPQPRPAESARFPRWFLCTSKLEKQGQFSSCNPFAIPLFLPLPWEMDSPQREDHQECRHILCLGIQTSVFTLQCDRCNMFYWKVTT